MIWSDNIVVFASLDNPSKHLMGPFLAQTFKPCYFQLLATPPTIFRSVILTLQ